MTSGSARGGPGRRVAAIDCGTNSLRLLIAQVRPDSRQVKDVLRRMDVVRLGEGVDRTGKLSEAALTRTFAKCDEFAAQIAAAEVDAVRFVATSAVRDASNRTEFDAGIESRLGVVPEVVSGDVEAALSFAGATGSLADRIADRPTLVLDIGGGSTEFVLGDPAAGSITSRSSVDVGCVRLTERCLHSDPPTATEVADAIVTIDGAIAVANREVDLDAVAAVVGVAGSITTLAAYLLKLDHYDPVRTHGAVLPAAVVHQAVAELMAMTVAQRAALSVMHPGRADVIAAGVLVLDRVLRRVGVNSLIVSEHDLLDGIALSLASGHVAQPTEPHP